MTDPTDPTDSTVPASGQGRVYLTEAAITVGAAAVAVFADRHKLDVPPELREDLAHDVLVAAGPHLAGWPTGWEPGQD